MFNQWLTAVSISQSNSALQAAKESSLLALLIYLTLIILSITSWAIIIKKITLFISEKKRSQKFLRRFKELEGNIVALSQEGFPPNSSPARLFISAYEELRLWASLDRDRNSIVAVRPVVPALERTLDRSIEQEKERWEMGTAMLATIASVAPLLGLLGTVWGIYSSFQEMGYENTASLETVGPGISEALLTTVAGLLVAIPAVFGHNGILHTVRRMENQMESFANEIINRFDRQILVDETPPATAINTRAKSTKGRPRGSS